MGRRLDAWLVAAAALVLLYALRQHTFYKEDGDVYLMSILEGNLQHPHHMLYKPLVSGLHRLLAWTGASLYEAGVLASALGTAIGLGCATAAARMLGLSRAAALAVPLLMLTVPALLFFATVVELHGVFLAFAGPALLALAALARAPSVARGLAFGASLALAYVGHASAALLPALLLPLALYYPAPAPTWARARALLVPAAAGLVVFVLFLAALPALGRLTGLAVDTRSAAVYVVQDAATFASDPGRWWTTLRDEWLAPYAPWNAVALVLALAGPCRGQARWLWLAVVPYYLVCVFLLPNAEFGAYLTPFAWPLALLALRALPAALVALCAAAGFAAGAGWIAVHDRPELAERFAAGVRAAAGGSEPFLLLGDHEDVKATLIGLPGVPHLLVLHAGAVPAEQFPAVLQGLDGVLRAQWASGRTILLTDGAARKLAEVLPSGPLVMPALGTRYRLQRVESDAGAGAFAGWKLQER